MKPRVTASLQDQTGLRCVDLIRAPDGSHAWQEYRRDPEDSTGWRAIGGPTGGFRTQAEARTAARHAVGWLEAPA